MYVYALHNDIYMWSVAVTFNEIKLIELIKSTLYFVNSKTLEVALYICTNVERLF